MKLTNFLNDNRLTLIIRYISEISKFQSYIQFCEVKSGLNLFQDATGSGLTIQESLNNLCLHISNNYIILFPHTTTSVSIRTESITNDINL